jgi:type II secretory pathway pseudopilin PulG
MALKPSSLIRKAWDWLVPTGKWKLLLVTLTVIAAAAYIVSLKLNLSAERRGRAEDAAQVAQERSDALQTASTARSAANEDRSTARRQIATETATKRKQLDDALAANQDWANQPVPRAVADSLR